MVSTASSFSSLRWPIVRLAKFASSFPIEFIVTVFCAVTLVYFKLLEVIRTSDFLVLDDQLPSSSAVHTRHSTASIKHDGLTGLWHNAPSYVQQPDNEHGTELWLRQFVVEFPATASPDAVQQLNSTFENGVSSILRGTSCHKTTQGRCLATDFTPSPNSFGRSFAFDSQEASLEFANRLKGIDLSTPSLSVRPLNKPIKRTHYVSLFNRNPQVDHLVSDGWDSAKERNLEEMRSVKWIIFAARAFVLRFWGLAKVTSTFTSPKDKTNAHCRKRTRPIYS